MGTITITPTFTKIDIRKTFESFEADLRMIVLRTGKWTDEHMENVCHDIYLFAEYAMLNSADITLFDEHEKPIRAAKYTVNENGNVVSGARPGSNNDWQNLPNTVLKVIITNTKAYNVLTDEEKSTFIKEKGFKSNWSNISVNLNYPNLSKEDAQLYGNKGYELKKENYK